VQEEIKVYRKVFIATMGYDEYKYNVLLHTRGRDQESKNLITNIPPEKRQDT
jgi:hypothetical protein